MIDASSSPHDAAADNDRTSGSMAEAKESVAVSGQLPAFTRKRSRPRTSGNDYATRFHKVAPGEYSIALAEPPCLALYQLHVGQ